MFGNFPKKKNDQIVEHAHQTPDGPSTIDISFSFVYFSEAIR